MSEAARRLGPLLPKRIERPDSLREAQEHFVRTKTRGDGTPWPNIGPGWERFGGVSDVEVE